MDNNHEMCITTPYSLEERAKELGFTDDDRNTEVFSWRIWFGSCDCPCEVCRKGQSGGFITVFRYEPGGGKEVKLIPVKGGQNE